MTDHRHEDDALLALLYDELSPDEAEAARTRLAAESPGSLERLRQWQTIRQLASELPEAEPDPQMHYDLIRAARLAVDDAQPKRSVWWQWLEQISWVPALAGLGLVVLAAGLTAQLTRDMEEAPLPVASAPEASSASKGELEKKAAPTKEAAPAKKDAPADSPATERAQQATPAVPVPGAVTAEGPAPARDKSAALALKAAEGEAEAGAEALDAIARPDPAEPAPAKDLEGVAAQWNVGDGAKTGGAPPKKAAPRGKGKARPRKGLDAKKAPRKGGKAKANRKLDAKRAAGDELELDLDTPDDRYAEPPPPARTPPPSAPPPSPADERRRADEEAPARGNNAAEGDGLALAKPEPQAAVNDEDLDRLEVTDGEADARGAADPFPGANRGGDTGDALADDDATGGVPAAAPVTAGAAPEGAVATDTGAAEVVETAKVADPVVVEEKERVEEAPGAFGGAAPAESADDLVAVDEVVAETVAAPPRRAESRRAANARPAPAQAAAPPSALERARAARRAGNHRDAVRLYESWLSENQQAGGLDRVWFETAQSYEAVGQVDRAIRFYRLAARNGGPFASQAQSRIAALSPAQAGQAPASKTAAPARPAADFDEAAVERE